MGNDHETAILSHEEKIHQDLVNRGDDYFKIELWRWALHYYKLALETGLYPEEVQRKIEVTQSKIKNETRAVIAIICVAIVLVTVIWIIATR